MILKTKMMINVFIILIKVQFYLILIAKNTNFKKVKKIQTFLFIKKLFLNINYIYNFNQFLGKK